MRRGPGDDESPGQYLVDAASVVISVYLGLVLPVVDHTWDVYLGLVGLMVDLVVIQGGLEDGKKMEEVGPPVPLESFIAG